MSKGITSRSEDYSRWYTDIVIKAELADYSPVKGCMVIRPNGFAIWERIRDALDGMIKETGHQNAYFPLFIPERILAKEAEHVEGFAPECAVVTEGGGKPLEEKLYIRPTSESIIYSIYSKWVKSYRDLPLLINQWANVVRWEMRTRLFLRTTEFLWQEGHTCHATEEEAMEETLKMLGVYKKFAEEDMAMPVIDGVKTQSEKFAGAVNTYTIEAMMQDKKALQAGTSHFLGQNFSHAFDIKYQSRQKTLEYVWQTCWGGSSRLVGALIMSHSDDKGLVLPPRLAPVEAVIVPIYSGEESQSKVLTAASEIKSALSAVRCHLDDRDQYKPGWKFNEWELKGVPLRIEIGPRDIEKDQAVIARRDTLEKMTVPRAKLAITVKKTLEDIQSSLFKAAKSRLVENTRDLESYADLVAVMNDDSGGIFARCHWCGKSECEDSIKDKTKASIRCVPLSSSKASGACIICGESSEQRVIVAKAY